MPLGEIKEEEATHLWELYSKLPLMVVCGLLTQEQADELKVALNEKLHSALGLSEE